MAVEQRPAAAGCAATWIYIQCVDEACGCLGAELMLCQLCPCFAMMMALDGMKRCVSLLPKLNALFRRLNFCLERHSGKTIIIKFKNFPGIY
jgi:hypothetical protein